jgi:PAS domain S-box-containing protein
MLWENLAFFILDACGSIFFVNPVFEHISGFESSHLTGKPFEALVDSSHSKKVRSLFEKTLGSSIQRHEIEILSRNGDPVALTAQFVPLCENDRVTRIVGVGLPRFSIRSPLMQHDGYTKLKSTLDSMEYGAYIVNRAHEIEYINPALVADFGPLNGRRCYEYFHDRTSACSWCKNQEIQSGKPIYWEWHSPKNGKTYQLFGMPVLNPQGEFCKLEIFQDITERRHSEEILKIEREKLKTILETMPHGVYIISRDYQVDYVNPALESKFGPVGGRKCHEYFFDINDVCEWCKLEDALAGKTTRSEWFLPKANRSFDVVETLIHDSERGASKLAVISDITEKKKAEQALKNSYAEIRHLSHTIMNIHEEDRRRLARELHDDLGQTLTLLKLRMRTFLDKLDEHRPDSHAELIGCIECVDGLMEDIRRISRNLCPAAIEDLGIKAAIQGLLKSFAQRMTWKLAADIADLDERFEKNDRTNIYRFLQQALTNIAKHARAENVFVSLRRFGDEVRLVVQDDGCGFDVEAFQEDGSAEKGLGLVIMRERAEMSGGRFELWSRKGEGTRVTFSLPLR